MAERKQQLKVERNPYNRFKDNQSMPQTDGRCTNFDFMSSADMVKQS